MRSWLWALSPVTVTVFSIAGLSLADAAREGQAVRHGQASLAPHF